jgi:hypothetical protein
LRTAFIVDHFELGQRTLSKVKGLKRKLALHSRWSIRGQGAGSNLELGMAYQPNPFVNPNRRGVELPAGCKDLNDVLAQAGVGEAVVPKS